MTRVTRIVGDITPASIDILEKETGRLFTTIKSYHFTEDQNYGHLAVIVGQTRMRSVLGNNAWIYAAPTDQGAYYATAINVANAATREQQVAKHKCKHNNYHVYLGVIAGGNDLIIYAVGEDALEPLKEEWVGFGDVSCQEIAYKRKGHLKTWDTAVNVTTYFKYLEDFRIALSSCQSLTRLILVR